MFALWLSRIYFPSAISNVCLSHAGGLMRPDLFIVFVRYAINPTLGPVPRKSRDFTGHFRVSQFLLYLKNGVDLSYQTSQSVKFRSVGLTPGLTLETSAFRIPVRWSIHIINSVDKTKFLCTTFPPITPQFL